MIRNWQRRTLGELCTFTSGGTPSKNVPRFWNGRVPFVSARDLKSDRIEDALLHISREAVESSATKVAPVGSLLMLVRGMGLANGIQVGEVTSPVAFNQDIRALVAPRDSVLPRFLLLALRNCFMNGEGERVLSTAAHGTLKIDAEALRQVELSFPPLSEQRRIVALLDEAFAGLATAKANAEVNLQNARFLFESHLQSIFTQRGKGWAETKLSEVCRITSTLVDPREREFRHLTHVGAGNIESKSGAFLGLKSAQEEGLISGKFLFDESMVLYSKIRPYLMKVARPDFRGLWSADMYPLAPIPKAIHRDFLFHLLLSKEFTDYAVQGSARAGMPKVNREHLFEFSFWIPDLKTQAKLAEQLDELQDLTSRLAETYERKLASLEALKESLLHHAFAGNLT